MKNDPYCRVCGERLRKRIEIGLSVSDGNMAVCSIRCLKKYNSRNFKFKRSEPFNARDVAILGGDPSL